MTKITASRRRAVSTTVGALGTLYAITFFMGAGLHLGVQVPLGFAVLTEPTILPAATVESLCGLALAISAYALFTRRAWAWAATIGAHAFALAGVLLRVAALAAARGPSTVLNNAYHLIMLVVLGAGLLLLPTRTARGALSRPDPQTGP